MRDSFGKSFTLKIEDKKFWKLAFRGKMSMLTPQYVQTSRSKKRKKEKNKTK